MPAKRLASTAAEPTDEVLKALRTAEHIPARALDMLCKQAPMVLGKSERHQFEERVVVMIEEVLGEVKSSLANQIEDIKAKLENVTAERSDLEAALSSANTHHEQKGEMLAQKTAALSEATAACHAAKSVLKEAQEAEKDFNKTTAEIRAKLLFLNENTESYTPLKNGPTEGQKMGKREQNRLMKGLVNTLGSLQFDTSLVRALQNTLETVPAERDDFDKFVLDHFESRSSALKASLEETIASTEPAKAEHAEKVASAKNALESAEQLVASCKEASANADVELTAALQAVVDSRSAVDNFAAEIENRKVRVAILEDELNAFIEGPLKVFAALKSPPASPESVEKTATETLPPEPEASQQAVPETLPAESEQTTQETLRDESATQA